MDMEGMGIAFRPSPLTDLQEREGERSQVRLITPINPSPFPFLFAPPRFSPNHQVVR